MPIQKIPKEHFFAIYKSLPMDLRTTLFSEETADKLMSLKSKYKIADPEFSELVKAVSRVLLGVGKLEAFIQTVSQETKTDSNTAQAIAQDINQAIFQPVKESLMAVHGLNRGSTPNQTQINADRSGRDANQRIGANNAETNPKSEYRNPKQIQNSNNQTQNRDHNMEAERKRQELLNKLKNQSQNYNPQTPRSTPPQNQNPPPARPANWHIPKKNVLDLRNAKKKNGYNGFFSA